MGILDAVASGLAAGFNTAAAGQMEQYKSLVEQERLEALQTVKSNLDLRNQQQLATDAIKNAENIRLQRSAALDTRLKGIADKNVEDYMAKGYEPNPYTGQYDTPEDLERGAKSIREATMRDPTSIADAMFKEGYIDESLKIQGAVRDERKLGATERANAIKERKLELDAIATRNREIQRDNELTVKERIAAGAEARREAEAKAKEHQKNVTDRLAHVNEKANFNKPAHDMNPDSKGDPEAKNIYSTLTTEMVLRRGFRVEDAANTVGKIVLEAKRVTEDGIAKKVIPPEKYNDALRTNTEIIIKNMEAAKKAEATKKAAPVAEAAAAKVAPAPASADVIAKPPIKTTPTINPYAGDDFRTLLKRIDGLDSELKDVATMAGGGDAGARYKLNKLAEQRSMAQQALDAIRAADRAKSEQSMRSQGLR